MNNGFERIGGLVAAYCLAAVVAVTGIVQMAGAQEEVPCPPLAGGQRVDVCEHPILFHLRHLPFAGDYLHRIVANDHEVIIHLTKLPKPGSLLDETCSKPTCCEEMLNRISVDDQLNATNPLCAGECDFQTSWEKPNTRQTVVLSRVWLRPGEVVDTREVRHSERRLMAERLFLEGDVDRAANTTVKFLHLGCPCGATGECVCAVKTSGSNECSEGCVGCKCEKCQCENCQCTNCPGKAGEAKCGNENCAVATMFLKQAEHHDEFVEHHPLVLMQHIASLMAEKSAAEAALEVRQEATEQLSELFEAMAEVMADNAALDARLQAQAEHTKLVEKMAELAAENARLKAHVELAAERAELSKSALSLTLENERLKLRLAAMEEKQELEVARTAAKPRGDRKPR
jgi:hypothetical protein